MVVALVGVVGYVVASGRGDPNGATQWKDIPRVVDLEVVEELAAVKVEPEGEVVGVPSMVCWRTLEAGRVGR